MTAVPPGVVAPLARPLRVCLVTVEFHGLFKNGGIGTANTALAVALAEHGFEVTVAFANSDESGPRVKAGDFNELKSQWLARGVTLDYIRPHPNIAASFDDPRTASYCVFLYLRSAGFDIVLFNDNGGQGYYSLLAKHTGAFVNPPLMYVVAHGPIDWVHELNSLEYYSRIPVAMRYLERRCAKLADVLVSPSRYLLEWMSAREWIPPGHGHIVQNLLGVEAPQDAGRISSSPQTITEIVFFGRQETRKGLSLFCNAIDLLNTTTHLQSKRITFLGKFGRIGAIHSGVYLAERVRRWQASVRVLAVYDQAEALNYLQRPGVLAVIPSRAENSPCVVAECLLLGLPFLATDSGGTAELVGEEDRASCLFPPEPSALAQRLAEILQTGQRAGRLAVSSEETRAAWIRLLESSYARHTRGEPQGEGEDAASSLQVTVCLVWSAARQFRDCLESLRRQTHASLEILVAFDERNGPSTRPPVIPEGVTLVSGTFNSYAAARDALGRRATGDYLLFVDESVATLLPDGVAVLAAAAQRTNADIVTGFRLLDAAHPMGKPGAREWELPLGACLELGSVENCFGEGTLLVKRGYFTTRAGFVSGGPGAAPDWAFLAGEVLSGAVLEVVPVPVQRLRDRTGALDDCERTVDDHRSVLQLYYRAPVETIARLVESNLRVGAQNATRMQRALQELSKPARDLALRLGSIEASSTEASRLFVNYCCERRMVDLALDFAFHNDVQFLPETVAAMSRANQADALSLVRARRFDLRHRIDLTTEVQARARPFYGLRAEELRRQPEGGLEQAAKPGDTLIKVSGICPPGTVGLCASAWVDSSAPVSLALVVCRSWARPVLSDTGILADGFVWWSGWIEASGTAAEQELTVELSQPSTELLDVYLLARRAQIDPFSLTSVTWKAVTAEVCLTGDITPSAVEMSIESTPLPADFLARGKLLTDTSDISFPVFVPGTRTLLHPLVGRLALVQVPEALPPGARGIRCVVSVEHDQAHPIEFGIWARPSSSAGWESGELTETDDFSGWLRVDAPLTKCTFTLLMAQPASTAMDIYIATRVVNTKDAYFCHAYWHEMAILEDVSRHPASQLLAASAREPRGSAARKSPRTPRSAYLLCAGARTGSNLLASALRRTGVGGMPFEYFNADMMNDEVVLRELGLTAGPVDVGALAARLDAIVRTGTTSNGIFGATVHWWDLERLFGALHRSQGRVLASSSAATDGLRAFFPDLRYVWLRRENKVAQAISHYLATRSGTWHRWVREAPRKQQGAAEIPFDFTAIKEMVATAEAEESGWRGFLADSAQQTLCLSYEELAADYVGAVARVLTFMDVTLPKQEIPPPAFLRQADARSLEWERLYREQSGEAAPEVTLARAHTG